MWYKHKCAPLPQNLHSFGRHQPRETDVWGGDYSVSCCHQWSTLSFKISIIVFICGSWRLAGAAVRHTASLSAAALVPVKFISYSLPGCSVSIKFCLLVSLMWGWGGAVSCPGFAKTCFLWEASSFRCSSGFVSVNLYFVNSFENLWSTPNFTGLSWSLAIVCDWGKVGMSNLDSS